MSIRMCTHMSIRMCTHMSIRMCTHMSIRMSPQRHRASGRWRGAADTDRLHRGVRRGLVGRAVLHARQVCVDACVDMCIHMCVDMRIDMCVDVCIDVCVGVCIDTCVDMCIHMCVDMCIDMFVDMCIDMCGGVRRGLVGRAVLHARQVCLDVHVAVCRHVHMCWACVHRQAGVRGTSVHTCLYMSLYTWLYVCRSTGVGVCV